MLNDNDVFSGQFALGLVAVLFLMVVAHLTWLTIAEMRKNRRLAENREQLGLILKVIATGTPLVQCPLSAFKPERPVVAAVLSRDSISRRWTTPANAGVAPYQWN